MSTNRLEAFSDGVFAVAITLLVLDLKVPKPHGGHTLAHELGAQWPSYVAFVVSFLTIGIIWINHHAMINRLAAADRTILGLNMILLMIVAALPFATSLMAAYLKQSRGEHLAAGVWSAAFLVMSIAFVALNRHILFAKTHLLSPELPATQRRAILLRGSTGLLPYVVATGLAPLTPYATLGICAAVAVFYALPIGSGERRER